jgi:HlyD family secretion protein
MFKNSIIVLFCFFMLVMVGFSSCKKEPEKTQVTVENITESVYASGIIKSKNQYQVFSTVNGLVQQVFVTEGDIVKIGDPIIQVINKTAQLNTENARLAADYAAFDANADKLNELKINIDVAKAKKLNDSLLLKRQRNLWAQQIGSQNELEQRELAYKNANATYNALLLRYNDLKKQLNFAAQQSKKNLQISSVITGDYIIRSQVNGKVYSLLKEKGEMVNTQSMVAIVGAADEFLLELQVDEYDIAKIRLGQKVLVSMDSYKGQVFEAKIQKIYPIMNDRTRSFTLEASFVTQPAALYPNLTTEANIVIQTKEHVLTIPRNYLIDDTFVLMENNQKVKVETGLKDYLKVEILRGVSPNDFIYKPAK